MAPRSCIARAALPLAALARAAAGELRCDLGEACGLQDVEALDDPGSLMQMRKEGKRFEAGGHASGKAALWDPDGETLLKELTRSKHRLCTSPDGVSAGEEYSVEETYTCGRDAALAVFRTGLLAYDKTQGFSFTTSCSQDDIQMEMDNYPDFKFYGGGNHIQPAAASDVHSGSPNKTCLPIKDDTILVVNPRPEYWGNVYHNMEEVFSLYETTAILKQSPSDFRLLFVTSDDTDGTLHLLQIDGQLEGKTSSIRSDGESFIHVIPQLMELWSRLAERHGGEKFSRLPDSASSEHGLCFQSRVVLPMRACSGEILTQTWSADPDVRQTNSLAKQYARRILEAFNLSVLMASDLPKIPTILMVQRAPRGMNSTNKDELQKRLTNWGAKVSVKRFEDMSYAEQLKEVHQSRVLVSTHGAGLSHAMFLPENGGLVEITPFDPPFNGSEQGEGSVANIFMNIAAWTDHEYRAVRGYGELDSASLQFDVDEAFDACLSLAR